MMNKVIIALGTVIAIAVWSVVLMFTVGRFSN